MAGGDVNTLLYDPRPLILCDDAKVVSLPTGYFEIEDADSSELFYKLGLRDGDIPISLNGFPLETSADAFAALSELWWEEGETSFDLYVERNSSFTTLYLNVYWVSP